MVSEAMGMVIPFLAADQVAWSKGNQKYKTICEITLLSCLGVTCSEYSSSSGTVYYDHSGNEIYRSYIVPNEIQNPKREFIYDTTPVSFTDVTEDTPYKDAIYFVVNNEMMLGDGDFGTFRPDDPLKRTEAAVLMTKYLGYSKYVARQSTTRYSDVPAPYWGSGYIHFVSCLNIPEATNGQFRPEDRITKNEWIEWMVHALGYDESNLAGNAPLCYQVFALSLGLVTRDMIGDEPITRGEMACTLCALYNSGLEHSDWTRRYAISYTINSLNLKDMAFQPIDAIPTGKFIVETSVTNNTSSNADPVLLVAYSDQGQMLDISYLYNSMEKEQTSTFGTSFDNTNGAIAQISAFVVPTLGDYTPLSNVVSIPFGTK